MAKLAHLVFNNTTIAEYLYNFPEDAERSVEGSLHIRPGTVEVTADELKVIEASWNLRGKFTVISRPSDTTETKPVAEEPAPVSTSAEFSSLAATPSVPPPEPETASETSLESSTDSPKRRGK